MDAFSKFTLKSIQQFAQSQLKVTLTEPQQIPFPFLITQDPFLSIDIEILWNEPANYQIELFKFYQILNREVKH